MFDVGSFIPFNPSRLVSDAELQYKDPDAIKKIKAATNDAIHIGLDAISEPDTQQFAVKTFGPGPGHLVVILPPQDALLKLRPDVKIQRTLFIPHPSSLIHRLVAECSMLNTKPLIPQTPSSIHARARSSSSSSPTPPSPRTARTWRTS